MWLRFTGRGDGLVSHYTCQRRDRYLMAQHDNRDLGAVGRDFNALSTPNRSKLPAGSRISFADSFYHEGFICELTGGLGFSDLSLVYLLMVVNFQSWLDSIHYITALLPLWPALCCSCFSRIQLERPLMEHHVYGLLATANSILVVTIAKERLLERPAPDYRGVKSRRNAFSGAVLDDALAMIIGMVPRLWAWARAASERAAGRAVIGG